ncbi:MAG: hypothetical protein F4X66_17445, partial [Chloroflexi bacterium]|nr:hypothetical protein [Chloroflexota bacterium]
ITSSPQSGDTYRQGEAITVALTFSEPVTVNGKPRIRLKIGDQKRWAGYAHSSEDGATLSFSHAVKADDQDADGIGIGKNQLKLNKGTIADAEGNPANLKHPVLSGQAAHKVNGAPDEPAQPEPEPTPTPTPEPANNAPQFASDTETRSVDENSPAGTRVGARVTATDEDDDTLTYELAGSDAFTINDSGRIKVQGDLDYETQASYAVTVTAADPDGETDSIEVTISVVNVDEPGVVRLSTDTPQAGSALIATVTDPDGIVEGSVAWQWKRSPDGTTADNVDVTDFNDIAGATSASIQLTDADDAGRWLRALAIYTDAFGKTKARAQTANPVAPDPNRPAPQREAANAAPQFADATATRSVDENTPAGTSVGAPVVATDDDGDTLTYSLTGSDAFTIDASGQITVASGADLDYETQASHKVTVSVHDGKNAQGEADSGVDDSIAVTISVVNVDEAGQVFLNTMEPQVGVSLSARVFDPDGGVSGEIWTWESSAYGSEWTAIAGATDAAYTPVDGDAGRYLRASASYADAQGAGKSARSDAAGPVTGVSRQILANAAPQFADATAAHSVDENTPAGTSVGDPIAATDGDGDTLTYELTGSDAGVFDFETDTGQIKVKDALDYEDKASYSVTVSVHDGKNAAGEADTSIDDTIAVTISVVNLNEPGVVSLVPDQPLVGSELTAVVLDPDGVTAGTVVWQWKRSPDGTTSANVDVTNFPNIAGATEQSFLLTDGDAGRWLRALAIYTDAFGEGQRARAQTANPALAQPPAPSITSGPFLNSPASGGVYGSGEEIVVSLTFSVPVTVSGEPRLGLVIGDAARWATYSQSSQDGATLIFSYAVQAGDRDDDGLSVTANSLELNGGSITGSSIAASLAHPGVADLASHRVNGSGPGFVAEPQNELAVDFDATVGFIGAGNIKDFAATPLPGGKQVKLSWKFWYEENCNSNNSYCRYYWQIRKKGGAWPRWDQGTRYLWQSRESYSRLETITVSATTVEAALAGEPTPQGTYEIRLLIRELSETCNPFNPHQCAENINEMGVVTAEFSTIIAPASLTPTGINAGDRFRLLFVTSTTRNAASTDIADYNTHVQTAAGNNAALEAFKGEFTALISTGSVLARDNTATTYTDTNKGVPIYWLGGAKVADDYEDFYDFSWDSREARQENGSVHSSGRGNDFRGQPWTGSGPDGTKEQSGGYAGASHVGVDDLHGTTPLIGFGKIPNTRSQPLYALSPVLIAPLNIQNLRAKPIVGGSRMYLLWYYPEAACPQNNPCWYQTRYRQGNGNWTDWEQGWEHNWKNNGGYWGNHTVLDLSPETTYEFQVKLQQPRGTAVGEGLTVTATTEAAPEVEVEASDTSMRVRWTGVAKVHPWGFVNPDREATVYDRSGRRFGGDDSHYAPKWRSSNGRGGWNEWQASTWSPNRVPNTVSNVKDCRAGTPSDLPFDSEGRIDVTSDSKNECGGKDGKWAWSFNINGLKPGTTYQVQLWYVARSEANLLGETEVTTEVRPRIDKPDKPSGFVASKGVREVTLTWNRAGGSTAVRYELRQKEGAGNWGNWTGISGSNAYTTTHTVPGLEPGTTYTFQIRGVNENGDVGEASDERSATPISETDTPDQVQKLTIVRVPHTKDVRVSWQPVPGVDDYYLELDPSSGRAGWQVYVPGDTTSHTFKGFTVNRVGIKAINWDADPFDQGIRWFQ